MNINKVNESIVQNSYLHLCIHMAVFCVEISLPWLDFSFISAAALYIKVIFH